MVFEYGMSEGVVSAHDARRQLRAVRGDEANARPGAGTSHRRCLRGGRPPGHEAPESLDRLAHALLEKETLVRDEMLALLADVEPESRSSETVGRVVPLVRPDVDVSEEETPSSG